MLGEVLGYDKYSEVTSEHAIRGTYCDLAVKMDGNLEWLLEVKAIGLELKEHHVKQAIDYAANQGVDYVILTNGVNWRVYKVTFAKPIDQELVFELDFCGLSHKNQKDLELLYLISREGWGKSLLGEYHSHKQVLSRYVLGAMILSDSVIDVIRRGLKRISADIRVDQQEVREILSAEVLKREVLEGDKADDARKKVSKAANKPLRTKASKEEEPEDEAVDQAPTTEQVAEGSPEPA